MRTAISVAALAVGALAVPYKRDVVKTDWDVVYVTDVVTVTAGQAPAAYTSASSSSEAPAAYTSASSSSEAPAKHYGHHNAWHPESSAWTSYWATTWTEAAPEPTTTSTSSTPVYTPPPSSTPEPETTTPVYVAPSPTSTYVAPTTSAAAATSAAAGGYGSADATYGKSVIDSHNLHRANHSAPDIEWDDDLYTIAKEIASSCIYAHDTETGGGGYGQNIAAGSDSSQIIDVITGMFYNGEEASYAASGNYDVTDESEINTSDFETWGHFSQVVWKDTTHVACYTTTTDVCPTIYSPDVNDPKKQGAVLAGIAPYFTVCNYKNPGNMGGAYLANIGKPLGHATVLASNESV